MARYLLDTNHLGAALDARSTVRERIFQARRTETGPAPDLLGSGCFGGMVRSNPSFCSWANRRRAQWLTKRWR
jgi:hypothetical protein